MIGVPRHPEAIPPVERVYLAPKGEQAPGVPVSRNILSIFLLAAARTPNRVMFPPLRTFVLPFASFALVRCVCGRSAVGKGPHQRRVP